MEEIRDNLIARIAEAEHEGWLGEVEGLRVSLAGAEDKLAQISRRAASKLVVLPAPTPGQSRELGAEPTSDAWVLHDLLNLPNDAFICEGSFLHDFLPLSFGSLGHASTVPN